MEKFRFTCARHKQSFRDLAARAGCTDPEKLDELGRKTLAWISTHYPRHVLDHFNQGTCLGCALEAAHVDLAEIECRITELAKRIR
jgi:hypothetical protein